MTVVAAAAEPEAASVVEAGAVSVVEQDPVSAVVAFVDLVECTGQGEVSVQMCPPFVAGNLNTQPDFVGVGHQPYLKK